MLHAAEVHSYVWSPPNSLVLASHVLNDGDKINDNYHKPGKAGVDNRQERDEVETENKSRDPTRIWTQDLLNSSGNTSRLMFKWKINVSSMVVGVAQIVKRSGERERERV